MKGILADVHMIAYVDALVREMQSDYWIDVWNQLGIRYAEFADVGLTPTSTDLEIWLTCQHEQLILLTNNRNKDSDDSLETAIRNNNSASALPVFTIGNLDRLGSSREYAAKVVEQMYDYLLNIDRVRGAGRLYLP